MPPRVSVTRTPGQSVQVYSEPVEQLIADYPELATQFARTVAWRDTGQPDRKSDGFRKKYPEQTPNVTGEP